MFNRSTQPAPASIPAIPSILPPLSRSAAIKLGLIAEARGESPEAAAAFVLETALKTAASKRRSEDDDDEPLTPEEQSLALLWKIPASKFRKVAAYAELREESIEQTMAFLGKDAALSHLPNRPHWSHVLKDLSFDSIELLEGRLVRIRLSNGRLFTDYASSARHQKLYYVFRDRIPEALSPETYQTAVNAMSRYLHGAVPKDLMPGPGGVMMECGAYVGYKAIAYAEKVGPTGRVIAVEIDDDNVRLLKRNIAENQLTTMITPVCCAVWHTRGTMMDRFEGRTRHTIADTDQHPYETTKEVRTDTLDNIMDDHGVETVDFMNLQLNGAEPEALQGLDRRFDSVKVLHIAAMFSKDGVDKRSLLKADLLKRGCEALYEGANGRGALTVVTPRFKDEIRQRQRMHART